MEAVQKQVTTAPPVSVGKKRRKRVRKGLLITSVVTSVLSFVPHARFAAAITSRSLGLVASVYTASTRKMTSWQKGALRIALLAPIVLGFVGFIAGQPVIIAAGLAVEIALRLVQVGVNLADKQWKKAAESGVLLMVTSVALAALLLVTWELAVVAAAFGACALFADAVITWRKGEDSLSAICYSILCTISLGSLMQVYMTDRHHINRSSL